MNSTESPSHPKATVCMITYNHGEYLLKAVEGVLSQETTFDFQLLISDDLSTDSTKENVQEYLKDHPKGERVKYICRSENLGAMRNFRKTLSEADGEYVAICEGDDYWTDPSKLQKQVEYLDAYPGASGCFHNVHVLTDGSCEELFVDGALPEKDYLLEDLFKEWFIPTCSMVYRRNSVPSLPDWVDHSRHGDLSLWLHLGLAGPLHYLPNVMGVYRKHGGGISHRHHSLQLIPSLSFVFYNFDRDHDFQYSGPIRDALLRRVELQIEKQTNLRVVGETKTAFESARSVASRVSFRNLCKAIVCKCFGFSRQK